MQPSPLVSVVMTVHNDAPFLPAAVESILGQTFGDFEYVIVHDASTDGSREILDRYADPRIRILDNPENLRLGRSLNRGVAAARGELIARLDANDIAPLDRLEKQVRFLSEHPELALVGGQYEAIDTAGRRIPWAELPRPVTEPGVQWFMMFNSPFIHSAVVFRKAVFDAVGGYDPAFEWAPSEDAELWSRMAAAGHRMVNLPDMLVLLRHDPTSITYDPARPHRAGWEGRLTAFFERNMRRILAVDDAQEWASLVAAFFIDQGEVPEETVRRYVDAVDALERRFIEVHPEAAGNPDIRAGKVQLLSRALFRKTPSARRSSAHVYLRMIRAHAGTARRMLPKFGAVNLLGPRAWKVWRWWRTRRGA